MSQPLKGSKEDVPEVGEAQLFFEQDQVLCAAPSAPIRSWSRFSYLRTALRDSCYLLDHGN
jgi:hypothetical protein